MKKLAFLVLLLTSLSLLAACARGGDKAAETNDPKVGDLYAAVLSEFAEFQQPGEKAYGLLKVIKVEPDTVTVVTDSSAWDDEMSAKRELRGDLKEVVWDMDDEIVVARSELAEMHRKEIIFAVRHGDSAN
ncbi:hypothetical protein QE424_001687 [Stenotrophomonas rhizophila]|uniref:Uncharacterized protein n=1 Tax=Stenotrophomonas rhizophila TaxID=216778 RepID=A0AAP5EE74_9GAMM|nr:hypothetical protein [Stenotrophomonas rhizophila]MDQ1108528.1 hypothetical protein [Stenotrophomonas rhizophila]